MPELNPFGEPAIPSGDTWTTPILCIEGMSANDTVGFIKHMVELAPGYGVVAVSRKDVPDSTKTHSKFRLVYKKIHA